MNKHQHPNCVGGKCLMSKATDWELQEYCTRCHVFTRRNRRMDREKFTLQIVPDMAYREYVYN